MSNTIPVKKMEAADPGLGFELDLHACNQQIRNQLKTHPLIITLEVTDMSGSHNKHLSTLTINPPITDPTISIVMPFGCDEYEAGNEFKIELEIKINNLILFSSKPPESPINIYGQGGTFEYRVKRPFLPRLQQSAEGSPDYSYLPSLLLPGDTLASESGRYILRLDHSGRLAIYDLKKDTNDPIKQLYDGKNRAKTGVYCAFLDQTNNLCIHSSSPDSIHGNNLKWNFRGNGKRYYPDQNITTYLHLDDSGKLVLRNGPGPHNAGGQVVHGEVLYNLSDNRKNL